MAPEAVSQDSFGWLFEMSGDPMWLFDPAREVFGLPRDQLLACTPADVSPPMQPDGRSSIEAAQAWIEETRRGQIPVFDWIHRHVSGRLIPCEVRLVRLPGEENCCRIRGSIIDNTERRRREMVQRATYEISAAVQATVDLDTLYRRIHEIIQGLMPARNFYIALFDPATGLITFPYHVDEISPHPQPMEPGTGLTGYVYRTGKPLLVNRRMRKRRVGEGVIIEGVQELPYVESGVPAAIWLGFSSPEELVGKHPAESAAPIQPGGERAEVLARKFIADCLARGSARFDWLCRNYRGRNVGQRPGTGLGLVIVKRALRDDPATMNIPFVFLTAKGERVDQRSGMNLGADDYLTKPVAREDLLAAVDARLRRQNQQDQREFRPDFSSPEPLLSLGLTPRVAEVLLWVAQGKTNADIATILGISESTVKKHLLGIFIQLGVETRSAATLRALEALSTPTRKKA